MNGRRCAGIAIVPGRERIRRSLLGDLLNRAGDGQPHSAASPPLCAQGWLIVQIGFAAILALSVWSVTEQLERKRLRSGVTVALKPGERQRRLHAADAALDEELKQAHPIVDRADVARRHPGEWIAIFPTHVDEASRLTAGRLFGHDPNRDVLDAKIGILRAAHPELSALVLDFSGPTFLEEPVVHA